MARFNCIGTALPKFRAAQSDILEAANIWLKDAPDQFAIFERFLRSAQTNLRYFVRPPREVIAFGGSSMRAQIFEREIPGLAIEAAQHAMSGSHITPQEIDGVIFTSCSCPIIPAPDTFIVEQLELPRDVVRIPAYQFGCAGGVIGLGLANRLSASLRNILLVSAELCSLVFQPSGHEASDLVGAAIFGDGVAATIISANSDTGMEIVDHRSVLLPETRHLMGYDIHDFGSQLRLDKELPSHLIEVIPGIVGEFLQSHKLEKAQIPWWLFHPGGAKIITCLLETLELNEWQAPWSAEVLSSVGNLSSASILFVIDRFIKSGAANEGDMIVILGIGPGLTVEMILARFHKCSE